MFAVALAVKSVLHYGLHGGNLTVNKVFHATRQRVVVKREAPDDNVRGNELFYAACHIIVLEALAGCALPAGKAALTGLDVELVNVELFKFHLGFALQTLYEGVCQAK